MERRQLIGDATKMMLNFCQGPEDGKIYEPDLFGRGTDGVAENHNPTPETLSQETFCLQENLRRRKWRTWLMHGLLSFLTSKRKPKSTAKSRKKALTFQVIWVVSRLLTRQRNRRSVF
ncbi:hypothetical protein, partial [Enterobacter cloacae complex sp. 4DZ1-17B1]|uniref:hypothetical protein n=1 Tax=Enterobacter cloacae complex sp. 4DZ1-17B1 TaxID=2511991 RepID=UPI001CA5CCA7